MSDALEPPDQHNHETVAFHYARSCRLLAALEDSLIELVVTPAFVR